MFRGKIRKSKLLPTCSQGWDSAPGRQGARAVPSRGREGTLTSGKWSGLPELPLGWVPGKPGAILTSPKHAVVSQHPAWPLGSLEGQPRMWSEEGRAPLRLAHGPCPVSVLSVLISGETTARSATVGEGGGHRRTDPSNFFLLKILLPAVSKHSFILV